MHHYFFCLSGRKLEYAFFGFSLEDSRVDPFNTPRMVEPYGKELGWSVHMAKVVADPNSGALEVYRAGVRCI